MIIKQVYENKSTGQLLVTVPRKKGIEAGDNVKITKEEKMTSIDEQSLIEALNSEPTFKCDTRLHQPEACPKCRLLKKLGVKSCVASNRIKTEK